MERGTKAANSGLDRLGRAVVAVTTATATCFVIILGGYGLLTSNSEFVVRAATPGAVGAVGAVMLVLGRPKVLVQLSIGAVMIVFYVGFADPGGRPGALLGMICMAMVGALFATRARTAFVVASAVCISSLAFAWSPAVLSLGDRLFGATGPGLVFVFVTLVVLWMKDELEEGRTRYRSLFERYRNLFETAPVGIWDLDFSAALSLLDGLRAAGVTDLRRHFAAHPEIRDTAVRAVAVRDLNRAAAEMVAAQSKRQVVTDAAVRNIAAINESVGEQLIAMWEGRSEAASEVEVVNLRGEKWDAALKMAALRDPVNPTAAHVIVSMVDVTERKRAAVALEQLVASKDEFVAAVSHELRTPLTTVVGLAEELRDRFAEFGQGEIDEFVSMIADESLEVAHIVEDLLVAAHTEVRPLALAVREVDLTQETESVLSMKRTLADVPISIEGAPAVLADPGRFRQILRNLLVNACRYGGNEVRVVVRANHTEGLVEVRDSGPALPQEERELIFNPYHRGHWVDGLAASVGLGLTVSRQLARMMGGDLVYKHNGRESVFRVTLPLAGAVPDAAARDVDTPVDAPG